MSLLSCSGTGEVSPHKKRLQPFFFSGSNVHAQGNGQQNRGFPLTSILHWVMVISHGEGDLGCLHRHTRRPGLPPTRAKED